MSVVTRRELSSVRMTKHGGTGREYFRRQQEAVGKRNAHDKDSKKPPRANKVDGGRFLRQQKAVGGRFLRTRVLMDES